MRWPWVSRKELDELRAQVERGLYLHPATMYLSPLPIPAWAGVVERRLKALEAGTALPTTAADAIMAAELVEVRKRKEPPDV